jgi:hypothetical protein
MMLCLLLLIQLQCTPNLSSRQSPCLQNTPCVMGGYFAREKRLLLPQTLRDRHIIHVVTGSLDFTIAAYQLRQSLHRVCLSGVVIRCPLNEQQEADMEDDELERSRRQSRAIGEGFSWDQEASEESTQQAGDEMNRQAVEQQHADFETTLEPVWQALRKQDERDDEILRVLQDIRDDVRAIKGHLTRSD